METMEANIEIVRSGSTLPFVKIILPIWEKPTDDGFILVSIPFLNLETIAETSDEIEIAAEEAIHCFFIAAEKFGQGLEKEIESLGWRKQHGAQPDNDTLFNLTRKDPVFNGMMNTGSAMALQIAV